MSQQIADIPIDQLTQDQFQAMRQAANANGQTQAQLQAVQRELAFTRAGIDTESPLGKMLVTSYTGDLTKEAILAWHGTLGLPAATTPVVVETVPQPQVQQQPELQVPAQVPVPQPVVTPQDVAAQQAAASLFTGATAPVQPTGPADPHTAGLEAYRKNLAAGMEPHEAGAAYLDQLMAAVRANPGDRRVVWTGFTEQELAEGRLPWQ